MKIILEGPDNAGKSTLAKHLSQYLQIPITHSGGPSKWPGEVNARAELFNSMTEDMIFDRHPCVSQNLYQDGLLLDGERVADPLIEEFYSQKPLIIYCRNPGTLEGHELSEHSSADYFRSVQENFNRLCSLYDGWALDHANHIYRIGDDMKQIALIVGDTIWGPDGEGKLWDPVADIDEFHRKFKQNYLGLPRLLPRALAEFREGFMEEEIREYVESSIQGQIALANGDMDRVKAELETQLDSLVDEVYVVLGTAHLQGFDFREAWRRVHAANMAKVIAMKDGVATEGVIDSGRNKEFDIVKPQGWQPPSHHDLVTHNAHNEHKTLS